MGTVKVQANLPGWMKTQHTLEISIRRWRSINCEKFERHVLAVSFEWPVNSRKNSFMWLPIARYRTCCTAVAVAKLALIRSLLADLGYTGIPCCSALPSKRRMSAFILVSFAIIELFFRQYKLSEGIRLPGWPHKINNCVVGLQHMRKRWCEARSIAHDKSGGNATIDEVIGIHQMRSVCSTLSWDAAATATFERHISTQSFV